MNYLQTRPKIIQWLIKYSGGLIKNEKQAAYVLFVVIVFSLIISCWLILEKSSTPESIEGTKHAPDEGYGGRELPDEFR